MKEKIKFLCSLYVVVVCSLYIHVSERGTSVKKNNGETIVLSSVEDRRSKSR